MKKIVHLENFVDTNEAKRYIDWIDDNLNIFLFLEHRKRYMLRFGYDQEYEEYATNDLGVLGEIQNDVVNLIKKVIEEIKNKFNEDNLYLASFFVSKHLPDSIVPTHSDGKKGFNEPLHYSALIYLNELENSGNLFFNIRNISIHPKVGDLVAFETHGPLNMHSVPEVSGNRYSIPIWLTRDEKFNILSC